MREVRNLCVASGAEESVVAPPELSTVTTSDGVRLALRLFAAERNKAVRAPFLLVHGLASNARMWDGVATRLAAAGHPVVAVDQRAHGASEGSDDLGFDRLVADLSEVSDALGLEQPVAVGQSWGGNVVLELGARHPSRVRGVVGVDGGLIELSRRFPDPASCWEALAPPVFTGMDREALEAWLHERSSDWPEGAAEAQLGNFVPGRPEDPARPILTRDRHRIIVEHLYHHRPLERLTTLEHRMLLLTVPGDDHRVHDDDRLEAARDLAAGGIDIVRLPGRHHDVHVQEPDTVARLLLDWTAGAGAPEDR